MRQEEIDVRSATTGELEAIVHAYERAGHGWDRDLQAEGLERDSLDAQGCRRGTPGERESAADAGYGLEPEL
jgi:hypothetical protein